MAAGSTGQDGGIAACQSSLTQGMIKDCRAISATGEGRDRGAATLRNRWDPGFRGAEDLQRAVRVVAEGGAWVDLAVAARVLATYLSAPSGRQNRAGCGPGRSDQP